MHRLNTISLHVSKKTFDFVKTPKSRWSSASNVQKLSLEEQLEVAKPFEAIPHLRMLPVIGTAWQYFPIIGRYTMDKMHVAGKDKHRLLGDIFRDKAVNLNIVILCKPDDIATVFRTEGRYPSRGPMETLRTYRDSRRHWYSNVGLLSLEEQEWWNLRYKANMHVLKPEGILAYLDPMQDVARDFIQKMLMDRDGRKEVPKFLGELFKWALESVALVGLDTRLGCLEPNLSPDSDAMKMIKSAQTLLDCMNVLEAFSGKVQWWKLKYVPSPTWNKFERVSDIFSEISFKYINNSIENLRRQPENNVKTLTILQSMMAKGSVLSEAMVMVNDMLLGGIHTTSHTVGYFLYNMAKNPDKQELLYKEISRLLPTKEHRISTEIFDDLKYLRACLDESQRLIPTFGGMARVLENDIVLSGYRVPAGTLIGMNMMVITKNKRYFSNPEQYIPERWQTDEIHKFAFLPFGHGKRTCIGKTLAQMEMICLIAEIIRNFKVEYHYEDIEVLTKFVMEPDKPLRFTFIER